MMKCGGWNYADMPECELPPEVGKAFKKATKELCGVKYTPVLYVGSQVVAGINYCIVCKSVTVTSNPITGCKVLFIYEDPEQRCSIAKIDDVIDYD